MKQFKVRFTGFVVLIVPDASAAYKNVLAFCLAIQLGNWGEAMQVCKECVVRVQFNVFREAISTEDGTNLLGNVRVSQEFFDGQRKSADDSYIRKRGL